MLGATGFIGRRLAAELLARGRTGEHDPMDGDGHGFPVVSVAGAGHYPRLVVPGAVAEAVRLRPSVPTR